MKENLVWTEGQVINGDEERQKKRDRRNTKYNLARQSVAGANHFGHGLCPKYQWQTVNFDGSMPPGGNLDAVGGVASVVLAV